MWRAARDPCACKYTQGGSSWASARSTFRAGFRSARGLMRSEEVLCFHMRRTTSTARSLAAARSAASRALSACVSSSAR